MMLLIKPNPYECNKILQKLINKNEFNYEEIIFLLKNAFILVSSLDVEMYNLGLKIICYIADRKPKDKMIQSLLHDCIVHSRVYLYDDMLNKLDDKYFENVKYSIFDSVGKSYYTLDTETVLTKDQKKLFDNFQMYHRIVVSAPTSFGKSRIISELIIHNKYKNVAIILPTIALLTETYHKFKNNELLHEYNFINSLQQNFNENKNNIFIFTPEKMDLFLDENKNIVFDFFVMDEIYKISESDERSIVFTNCLYRLIKKPSDFYLIGPYFNNFSEKFLKQTNAKFIKFDSEIVHKNFYNIYTYNDKDKININGQIIQKCKSANTNLLKIVSQIDGQNLIYVDTKKSVESKAKIISNTIDNKGNIDKELIEYIKENISENWILINCLEKGIAFHHGGIPKYLKTEIVDAFNDGKIQNLVCTTSLIEGVNTSAKNVIIFSNKKANDFLTGFEVKNIHGRAGRFMEHFIGRVIVLEKTANCEDKDIIEFKYLDDNSLNPEEIIQIDNSDLNGDNLIARKTLNKKLNRLNIPFELIKSNKYISVIGQIRLINLLRNDSYYISTLLFKHNLPEKEQLDVIIQLCHDNLFSQRFYESKNFPLWKLQNSIKYYVYYKPTLKQLIANYEAKQEDTKIRNTFRIISDYFEFALPKYLTAFERIFNFVYGEKYGVSDAISLTYLITLLEFGFSESHEIALKDAGIPRGIIKKISRMFLDCKNIEEIRMKLSISPRLLDKALSDFEKKMFFKYI